MNTKRRVFFHQSRDFSRRASRLNAKDSFCRWSVLSTRSSILSPLSSTCRHDACSQPDEEQKINVQILSPIWPEFNVYDSSWALTLMTAF